VLTSRSLIITIDTEENFGPGWEVPDQPCFSGVSEGIGEILGPIFYRLQVTPTYLVSPIVLYSDESVSVLKSQDNCELGTHLHVEQIDPGATRRITGGKKIRVFQSDLDEHTERAKLTALTELFISRFQHQPLSFRAGRWGISQHTCALLADLGYIVDSSVLPHTCHSSDGAHQFPDFRECPSETPYRVSAQGDFRIDGNGPVLEIPVTVVSGEKDYDGMLRPRTEPSFRLKKIIDTIANENDSGIERPLVMMLHNIEVIPNASPFVKNQTEQATYLQCLTEAIEYALHKGFIPTTLSKYADHYPARLRTTQ